MGIQGNKFETIGSVDRVYIVTLRDVNFETECLQDGSKDCCVVFRGDKDKRSE